ncbi:S-layer homology domain-containing protein [Paenibacillus whitsoniae]|uniref:DUF1349 domain-containing protein n=1 Tax=Paenibacillus whitsoniae TaxID=2496558 RepID=A0A430JBF2_9BACL|nr:S-layer homology domain-containing protein [Paenibacillus whitsoniae]RTE08360.1 DUF1349 domain-containing protein [Paenibacillus whitsoniae]
MFKRKLSAMLASAQLLSLLMGSTGALASAPDDPSNGGAGASVTSAVYAANSTSSSITLAWPAVPGAAGYNLYRSLTSSGTFTKVNGAPVAATTYLDSGLTANVRYFYKVTSISGGLESDVDQASILTQPDFGPNVYIFDSLTPPADIQRTSDNLFAIQEQNQFGQERYAMLFKQGSYTTNIRLGFYTQVAGLGMLPDDVNFTGGVSVDANWLPPHNATQNFWRSVENFAETPSGGNMLWAVSQAASMRRVHVKGGLTLHDQGGWASGGYLADSVVDGNVVPGSQQQWFSRNSQWASWNGSVWNTTLLGNVNPPVENWPTNAYTVINQTPVVREKPFLTWDQAAMQYNVFVPDVRMNANGTSWGSGTPAGTAISIENFFIANPAMSVDSINAALAQGKHLLLTPGVYHTSKPIEVTNPNTVVLGLGLATLHADSGNVALKVADVDGVKIAGLLFEAGATNSPVLLQVGAKGSTANHAANPTSLQDLYFRVGGDALALADVCVEINSNNVIGDHFWVWRADHGTGAGWDSNLTTNGMIVNGNDVVFYGLFVEHFHQYQTVWNGERGKMYFYQTEIPYDVPNQERWMSSGGTVNGYASYKVADTVTSHEAYGLGLYSFFRDAEVKLDRAIEIPDVPGVKIHHATTVFLGGMGEITHVANAAGTPVKKGTMRTTLNDYVPRTTSGIQPVVADTYAGKAPFLPETVTQQFSDASSKLARVTWHSITPMQFAAPGTFTVQGVVEGTTVPAQATVTVYPAPNAPVTGIMVGGAGNATTITAKHGTLQMLAAVSPAGADNSSVTWRVFDTYGQPTSKASIDANGLLTAADNGTVKVVASANDHSGVKGEAWITITGQVIKASGITVTGAGNTSLVALKGGTLQMSAAVAPDNADDPSVTWSVVNPDDSATTNASISTTGLLTAKGNGAVKVVAKANDGSNVTGSMLVTLIGQSVNLDSRWSWVRESAGSWALDPKNGNVMKLSTQEGTWGSSSNYPKGVLLTDPGTAGDFTITTKLKFDASKSFEWAGLIVYKDDKNLISFGRSAVNQLRFSQVSNGAQTEPNIADPLIGSDIYLKIQKVGTTYTAYYSADGQTWTQHANTFTINLSNAKVGIFTRKLNTAIASKTAEFTDFRINGVTVPYWNPVSSVSVASAGGLTEITAKGGTLQMAADVQPSTAANKTVFWSVYNPDGAVLTRATINASGLLVAQGNGSIQVVATAADGSAAQGSMALQISGQTSVSAIAVAGTGGRDAIQTKSGTLQMVADVAPSDAAIRTVTWSVYNPDGTETDRASIDVNGVLTALKNGQVKVVATADDGSGVKGEAVIAISGQELVSPPDPITPSSPADTSPVGSVPSVTSSPMEMHDGKAVVTLTNGSKEAILTAPSLQLAGDRPVEVRNGGIAVSIPSAVMQQLVGQVNGDANLSVKVRIDAVPAADSKSENATLKFGGHVYDLSLTVTDGSGKETKLASFKEPVQVVIPYGNSQFDEELIAAYLYDEQSNKWQYIGGHKDTIGKTITFDTPHFSKYAVMEYNKSFNDVPKNHWAYRTLQVLSAQQIVTGITDTEFRPEGTTTRAEFVTLLVKALGLKGSSAGVQFEDVSANEWYASDIQTAYRAGLISGISAHEFAPNAPITREQMASLIVRAYEHIHGVQDVSSDHVTALTDSGQVSSWATVDVNKAIGIGLMQGQGQDIFAAQSHAVRAETAQAILNMLKKLKTW